jgi:hypothetical protein
VGDEELDREGVKGETRRGGGEREKRGGGRREAGWIEWVKCTLT